MIRLVSLLILCCRVDAAAYSAKDIVLKMVEQNLTVKSLQHERKELSALGQLVLAPYDYQLFLEGNSYRDKSIQDTPASPSNMDSKKYALGVSKKWSFGVQTNLTLSNNDSAYTGINFATLNPHRYQSNKSSLGASVVIDLSQNIGGRIDRILLNNMVDQEKIIHMSNQEKIEGYLLSGVFTFYRLIMAIEGEKLYQEMKVSALSLLKKAQDRRRRGIVDNRALYIYRSNLSTTEKMMINGQNVLDLSFTSFENFLEIPDNRTNFSAELNITPNELAFLGQTKNMNVKEIAKRLRVFLLKDRGLQVERRKLDNYSYKRLPKINFTLSATGTGNESNFTDSFDRAKDFSDPQYLIGLQVSYPIGNGAASNSYFAQKNRVKRVELEIQDQLKSSENELRHKIAELNSFYQLVDVAKKHMQNEKKKYENEMQEYRRGRSRAKDVVQFQNDYLSANLGRTEAVVNFKMALNGLLFQLGKFSTFYNVSFDGEMK